MIMRQEASKFWGCLLVALVLAGCAEVTPAGAKKKGPPKPVGLTFTGSEPSPVDVTPPAFRPVIGTGGPTWFKAKVKPIPGIDNGSIRTARWNQDTVFAIWTDNQQGIGSSSTSTDRGATYSGWLTMSDTRKLDFACETTDGMAGFITLAGKAYDLKDGTLFLVSTAGPEPRVKQLKSDIRKLKDEEAAFLKLAEQSAEIGDFFTNKPEKPPEKPPEKQDEKLDKKPEPEKQPEKKNEKSEKKP
jgi:hypothetical protein